MNARPLLPFLAPRSIPKAATNSSPPNPIRAFTTSALHLSTGQTQTSPSSSSSSSVPSSRWLSETKSRLGKCITFGLTTPQTQATAKILSSLGSTWRDLVAGREGFLTSPKRAGLLRQRVVWGEMDSMGHVNNVTYTRYAESARVEWMRKFTLLVDGGNGEKEAWSDLMTPRGEGLILRSIRTDYKFPMTWPDHISVFHKLRNMPSPDSTSFILDVMILSELHQRPAARCVEDIVVYDYRIGKPIAVRPFMMEAFQRVWDEQQKAMRLNLQRIEGIEREVRELERQTWDREDAVEDFGGAA